MAISKHVEWDGREFHEYVDLGIQNTNNLKDNNNNMLQASNAFVFMLTCINQSFKIPIAYYLINSLTGLEKKTF